MTIWRALACSIGVVAWIGLMFCGLAVVPPWGPLALVAWAIVTLAFVLWDKNA